MVSIAQDIGKVVHNLISSGEFPSSDSTKLAERIDGHIRMCAQKSLKSALHLARGFVTWSKDKEPILYTTALRSLGRVSLLASDYNAAREAYLKARHLLKRDWLVRGQIDRTLIDIYMYLGNYSEAKRHARIAIDTFNRHGSKHELAKTRVNYGNLYHRQDRHREAIRLYEQAYRTLRRGPDKLSTAVCCYNKANALVQLFVFEDARMLYREAEKLFRELGYDLYANEARYGLAWLSMLEGDYHLALQSLSECESSYLQSGRKKGVVLCQLDRAEAYLGLNLFHDARDAARLAEKNANGLDIYYESAKAAFFYAKASHGIGKTGVARRALKRAEHGFKKADNAGFLAAVHFFKTQLESTNDKVVAELRSARKKIVKSQLPLWEAICDLQLISHCPDDQNAVRRVSRNPAVRTVPHLKAHWQTILGDRLAGSGQREKAKKHWCAAADILDAVRVKLPPQEMRSSFKRGRSDPYLQMIESELMTRPDKAAAWSERYKTAGLWAVPPENDATNALRQRAERSLIDLAARVTSLTCRHKSSHERNFASTQSDQALRGLQARARQDLGAIERQSQTDFVALESLLAHINTVSIQKTLVQYHFQGEELIAFVHWQGQSRICRIPHGRRLVDQYTAYWNFMVAREQFNPRASTKSSLQEEKRLLDLLGQKFWTPLDIGVRQKNILIILDGRLGNLPWLAFRHQGEHLASRHNLSFSPSLLHYIKAKERRIRSKNIEVFVGQIDNLKNARSEISALRQLGNGSVQVHDPCRRADWPNQSEARVWHYTGHAQWRPDNPFYSSLLLSDGPLFAADFRLKKNKVGVVVLAACRSGRASVLPGDEADGLVRSLLEMGAKNVIASHWAVSDRSTAFWMNHFYKSLQADIPVGKAVAAAALKVREKYPSAYDWSAFSIFGVG